MRGLSLSLTIVLVPAMVFAQVLREGAASADAAAAFALIAADVAGQAVRTEVIHSGADVILRVTAVSASGAFVRERPASAQALEARVTRGPSGDVTRVTVTGAVTERPRVRVSETATAEAKRQALQFARFGTESGPVVREAVAARAAALGGAGTPTDATLVWRRAGAELQPVWQVRVSVARRSGTASYMATLDAADGTLLALEREEGR